MNITELWGLAEQTGESIDIGNTVACDLCSDDYTESTEQGGIIFQSSAYCPKCTPQLLRDVEKYDEQRFIRARCPEGVSFADFVRGYRGPNAAIQITKGAR